MRNKEKKNKEEEMFRLVQNLVVFGIVFVISIFVLFCLNYLGLFSIK